MKDQRTSGSWRTAWECLLASLAMAVLTLVSFRLHAGPAMAALLYFFLVILISLWAGFLPTALACAVAALCYVYFFTQPIYHFWMSEPVEIAATMAFSSTALIISRLLARVRERTAEVQRTNEQLQVEIAERKRAEESLHRLNRELRALSNCNQTLMRATDEPALLREICRIVCEEAGYRVAWVGYAEPNEAKSVRPVAWIGTEEGDVANLGITWADTERGRGIIGMAIRSGKTCCIKDYATDPEVAPWRESALQHGFRSAIALPLKDERANIFGSLNIYSAQPNAFTPEETRLLEELAGDMAFGIVTLRSRAAREQAEQKVRRQEMELRQVLDLTPLLVAVFGPDGERLYANRPTLDYFGVTLEEWQRMSDRFSFYHPDDRERLASDVYTGPRSEVPHEFEARFRKGDETYRWFLFRDNPVRDEQGRITRWYFSATDIEDRKRAEEERRARVWFLESLDRVNRAIGGTNDLEQMTGEVINAMRSIFACDRAFLYYPCDPDAPSFEVFMERTRPEYPAVRGVIPMTPETAKGFQIMRASSGVVTFGPECDYPLIGDFAQRFGHQSSMGIAIHPRTGQPWVLAMQQCAYPRAWTAEEKKLLEETARRLTDSLTSLLMFRSLRESEEALRHSEGYLAEAQRLTHTGAWAHDGATWKTLYWSEETFRIWGFDPRQGLPTFDQILQRIHPQDLHKHKEASKRAVLEKADVDCEHRIVLPDATVKHVYTLAHPVLNAAGEVLEVSGTSVDITDRKRAEEVLRRSEAYLASAQKLTRTGTYAMNGTSREPIYWSEEMFRLFGIDPNKGLATRDQVWQRIHPEDHDKVKESSDRVFLEKVDSEVEYRIVLPDGTVKVAHIQAHPVLSANGEVGEVVATMVDITDRKRAEKALRAQAALLDLTHDTVFVMDMEGVIKYWNRGAEERYGWTAEQALGRVVHDLLKTVFPGPREEIRGEVSRTGRWEGEILHTKKDGTQVVVASRWALQRDERGAPLAILETNNDITLRKRAEEALRLSNAYNRSLIEASVDPLVTIGPDGEITDVNAATEAATGCSRGELVGTDFCDYFTEPANARAGYEQVFREGMVRDYPLELRHRDGGVMSVLYNASVYRDESGRVTGVFAAARDITERRRAEEAMHRSQAYLAEAQSLSHTGSFGWKPSIGEIQWSEETYRIFQYDRTTKPTVELVVERVHPEDRTLTQQILDRTSQEEKDYEHEYRLLMPDGSVKYLQIMAHVVRDESGSIEFVGAAMDVTAAKQAEEAVRESETRFRTFVDHAADALFIQDFEQGTIIEVNRRACESLGYTRQELIGTTPLAFDVNLDQAALESIAERAAAGETALFERHWHRRKDGSRFPVEVHISTFWHGGRRFLLKIARDITDRLQAEEALRRSEAYLAEGQRLSHAGSFAWSTVTLQSLFWSEEMCRIFGLNPQEGVPTIETFWQRIHPEDLDRTRELLLKAAHGNMEYEHDHRILLPDGTVKHIHATGHPVVGENGQVVEYVGTAVDVTDRKRAEEERERLRQLEADLAHIDRISMMGELAASVAHEVNQPLSGVVVNGNACLRWLAGDSPNLEEAREAVRRIVRDGKRAGDIITRIRALATKTATAKERLDLNEAVQEVVAFAGDQLRKNRVAVRTEFAPGLSPVLGDRVQLQQVALNLVMNAIEAMSSVEDRPRELIVRTQNDEAGQVQVTVQDSGIGLDPQSMERIFDAFYTTKRGGMGMGLSISRSIIQNHGGKLWAVANDGPGTSVQFTIPKHQ